MTDLLKDTFAQKKAEEPTVQEILAEEDNKEKEKDDSKKEEEKPKIGLEDITVMKLIEEIVEYDQEIKMK